MANPNPHLPHDAYEREVERCVRDLGFVGVKLHPLAHAVNPRGRHGCRVFDVAAGLGVPVMVHTGLGIPWSAPSLLDGPAERYPELPLIVAHAGGGIFAGEAAALAARFPNVYLECSWAAGFFIRHLVEVAGADRLMFGSDHADNACVELAKLRSLGLDPADLARILGQTARIVWGIEPAAPREDAP
jgi:predicted TIM-barrel fold metal-dependent hydrolase